MESDEQYFATKEGSELTNALYRKKEIFRNYTLETGRMYIWQKAYHQYYIGEQINGGIYSSGSQGEVIKMPVNHYRNLLQHIFNLVIQQQINFDCRATNTDSESTSKTILSQQILEYYTRHKKVRRYNNLAAEYAAVYGEGYVSINWDPNRGEVFNYDDEDNPIYSGDMLFDAHTPNNVYRDPDNFNDDNWVIVMTPMNKYDLAEQFRESDPKIAERIIGIKWKREYEYELNLRDTFSEATDIIPYYRFFHKKTPAVPNGRFVEFLDDDIIIFSGDLPYKNVPVYKIKASDQHENPFGYTIGFDLMPLQDTVNALHSTIVTVSKSAGIKTLVADKGAGIRNQDIDQGLRLLYKEPGYELSTVELGGVSNIVPEYLKEVEARMETISGVNSEARGRIQREMSGSALALLHQITAQFMSQYEEGYKQINEDVAQGILEILQEYAFAPQVAEIGGKSKRTYMRDWNKDDLAGISSVVVDIGNPQARTFAGRLELAKDIMQIPGAITSPQDYLMVIETGKADHMMEDQVALMHQIRQENEQMSKGEIPQAIATDNHTQHIKHHSAVMSSPEARKDPNVVAAFQQHMLQHTELQMNPDMQPLYQMLGYNISPIQGPPPPAPPGPNPANNAGPNLPGMPTPPKLPNGQPYNIQ